MFRYYLARGHSKKDLEHLSRSERCFFSACKELDQEEQKKKYSELFGSLGG